MKTSSLISVLAIIAFITGCSKEPEACFTANPQATEPGETITFTDCSENSGSETQLWDFGDGSPSGTGTPINHIYTTSGNFTVVLTSENSHGESITKRVVKVGYPPKATIFTYQGFISKINEPLELYAVPHNSDSYQWSFPDGTTESSEIITHTFTQPGTYTVRLIAFSNNSNFTDTTTADILVVSTFSGQYQSNSESSAQLRNTTVEIVDNGTSLVVKNLLNNDFTANLRQGKYGIYDVPYLPSENIDEGNASFFYQNNQLYLYISLSPNSGSEEEFIGIRQ
jgi:PKD repeat protein